MAAIRRYGHSAAARTRSHGPGAQDRRAPYQHANAEAAGAARRHPAHRPRARRPRRPHLQAESLNVQALSEDIARAADSEGPRRPRIQEIWKRGGGVAVLPRAPSKQSVCPHLHTSSRRSPARSRPQPAHGHLRRWTVLTQLTPKRFATGWTPFRTTPSSSPSSNLDNHYGAPPGPGNSARQSDGDLCAPFSKL
jgi:hypothetical protein